MPEYPAGQLLNTFRKKQIWQPSEHVSNIFEVSSKKNSKNTEFMRDDTNSTILYPIFWKRCSVSVFFQLLNLSGYFFPSFIVPSTKKTVKCSACWFQTPSRMAWTQSQRVLLLRPVAPNASIARRPVSKCWDGWMWQISVVKWWKMEDLLGKGKLTWDFSEASRFFSWDSVAPALAG